MVKKIETTLYLNTTSYNLQPYFCFIIMKHVYMNTNMNLKENMKITYVTMYLLNVCQSKRQWYEVRIEVFDSKCY